MLSKFSPSLCTMLSSPLGIFMSIILNYLSGVPVSLLFSSVSEVLALFIHVKEILLSLPLTLLCFCELQQLPFQSKRNDLCIVIPCRKCVPGDISWLSEYVAVMGMDVGARLLRATLVG